LWCFASTVADTQVLYQKSVKSGGGGIGGSWFHKALGPFSIL
jgi:hypothetical protein